MADEESRKETVVVDRDSEDRRSLSTALVIVLVILAIIVLFLLLGGFGLFSGGETNAPAPATGGGTPAGQ